MHNNIILHTPRIIQKNPDEFELNIINTGNELKDNFSNYIIFKFNEIQLISKETISLLKEKIFERLCSLDAYSFQHLQSSAESCANQMQSDLNPNRYFNNEGIHFLNNIIQTIETQLTPQEKINQLFVNFQKERLNCMNSLDLVEQFTEGKSVILQLKEMNNILIWTSHFIKFLANKMLIQKSILNIKCNSPLPIDNLGLYLLPDEDLERSIMMHGKLYPSSINLDGVNLVTEYSQAHEEINSRSFIEFLVKSISQSPISNTEDALKQYFSLSKNKLTSKEKKLLDSNNYKAERNSLYLEACSPKNKKKFKEKIKIKQICKIRLNMLYDACPALKIIPLFTVNFFNPAANYNRSLFPRFFSHNGNFESMYRMQADALYGTHYDIQKNDATNSINVTINKKFYITQLLSSGEKPELASHILSWTVTLPIENKYAPTSIIRIKEMIFSEEITKEQMSDVLWMLDLKDAASLEFEDIIA